MTKPLSGDMSGLGTFLALIAAGLAGVGYVTAKTAGAKKPLYWAVGTPVALGFLFRMKSRSSSKAWNKQYRESWKDPAKREAVCKRGISKNFEGYPGNNYEECLQHYLLYSQGKEHLFKTGAPKAA